MIVLDNVQEKLEKFTSVIVADAKTECDAIYEEVRKQSQVTLDAAEDEALSEAFRYIKTEIAKINTDNGRQLSRVMMEQKRELYLRRETMADETEAAVQEKLSEYVKTPAYSEQVTAMAKRLLEEFDADTIFYLRLEDEPLKEKIAAIKTKHTIQFAQGHFHLGGLEAACPARKRHIDAAFDSTLQQLRSQFFELFGLKLSE